MSTSTLLLIAVFVIFFFGVVLVALAMLSRASRAGRKRRHTLDAGGLHPMDVPTQ
jgi:hypothetical protein